MDEHEVTKRLSAQHSMMETKISRKFMEEHAPFNQLKRWTALAILFILTAIVISVLYLYRTPSDRIFVARIKTNTGVDNYSKRYGFLNWVAESGADSQKHDGSLLAQEGDLLYTNNCSFTFQSKKDSFDIIDQGDSLTYIDGQITGISLEKNSKSLAWLDRLTADSLKQLRSLSVESPIQESYLPYLKKISGSQKNISLTICDKTDSKSSYYENDLTTLAKLFTPDFLSLSLSAKSSTLLGQFRSIKSLMIGLEGDSVQQLPFLPNLRECMILTSNGSYVSDQLFKNNSTVEKLSITPSESVSLGLNLIKSLPHLKQLTTGETVYFDIDSLHEIAPGLTTLVIADSCKNIPALAKFKDLKWLGLPPTANQSVFDAVINGLPNLQVLELCGGDSIKNLRAIETLKDLKGLVIAKELPDSNRLFAFKQLRYLSIPEESYKDSLFQKKLTKALPGCIIVPNGGACLGSGWLLLLIPCVVIIIYFRTRITNATRQL